MVDLVQTDAERPRSSSVRIRRKQTNFPQYEQTKEFGGNFGNWGNILEKIFGETWSTILLDNFSFQEDIEKQYKQRCEYLQKIYCVTSSYNLSIFI